MRLFHFAIERVGGCLALQHGLPVEQLDGERDGLRGFAGDVVVFVQRQFITADLTLNQ